MEKAVRKREEVPNKNTRKRKPMKHKCLFKTVSIFMIVTSLLLIFNFIKIGVFGIKYISIFTVGLILIEAFLLFVMNKRFKVVIKIPFLIVSIFISGACLFGVYNLNLAANFVQKIVSAGLQEERYEIYILKESSYTSLDDLNKANLGYFNNESDTLEEALMLLKKKVTFKNETSYDDLKKMLDDCINAKTDAIFLSSSLIELLNEEYEETFFQFKKLSDITVSSRETTKKSNKNVTKDPFLLYVSGIDTYGSIGTVSRSDVNILIAVNPKTSKVLLVNTPRDYYVKLHSKKAMDKLTHAGIYGIEESMNTLGDLYASNVDYYLKINFSSLIKIVDSLGGITVDSKYEFSYDGFTFKKGENNLNGKAALAFSRFRKGLPLGDVSRGENQEAVIEGIIEKMTSPSIITKYANILKTMEDAFVTNMDEKDIYAFAKFQLNKSPKWIIEKQNAYGRDSYETTYSAGKTKLYVMLPQEESVTEVKNKLNDILEG
ncbi:MAG TPA: hypothetical protein DCY94_02910 [Firmicutes bacterium]|nr:hypothetical protein [Bacillota bacterium]